MKNDQAQASLPFKDDGMCKAGAPGETALLLTPPDANYTARHRLHVNPTVSGHISIVVEDMQRARRKLREMNAYAGEIVSAHEGNRLRLLTVDPAGNVIELVQKLRT